MSEPTLNTSLLNIADAVNEARVIAHLVLRTANTPADEVDVAPWLGHQLLEVVDRIEDACTAARAMVLSAAKV